MIYEFHGFYLGGDLLLDVLIAGFNHISHHHLLRVHPVIDVRENIVLRFDIGQPFFINVAFTNRFVQEGEADEVIFGAFLGVLHHRPGVHDERPVACLRQ